MTDAIVSIPVSPGAPWWSAGAGLARTSKVLQVLPRTGLIGQYSVVQPHPGIRLRSGAIKYGHTVSQEHSDATIAYPGYA